MRPDARAKPVGRWLRVLLWLAFMLLFAASAGVALARMAGHARPGGTQLAYSRATYEAGVRPFVDLIDIASAIQYPLHLRYGYAGDAEWLDHDHLLLRRAEAAFTLVHIGGAAQPFLLPATCDPTISAFSRRYLACALPGGRDLLLHDLDCLLSACDQPPQVALSGIGIHRLVWSPDGRQLVLHTTAEITSALRLYDAAAGTLGEPLATGGLFYDPMLAWSPDSTKLAFFLNNGGQTWLAHYDVPTASLRRTVHIIGYWPQDPPSWSPDSREVVFYLRDDYGADLYVLDLASGQTRRLAGGNGTLTGPQWSPDGRQIASFVNNRRGSIGVYLVDALAGALQPLRLEVRLRVSYRWRPCREAGC